jgi:hypothetical protein
MSEKIKYSLNVQVVGGPSVPINGEVAPEAYEKIQIGLSAGAADKEMNLQPGGNNLANFLLIKASSYNDTDPTHTLTYKVNNTGATAITLDGPHIFIGKGAVGILDAAPTKLFFSNSLTSDVTIDILIGRDATP